MMLTDDPERTYDLVKHQIAWRYDTYNAYSAMDTGRPAPDPVDPDRWRPGASAAQDAAPGFAPAAYHIVTPDEGVRRLKELAAIGLPIADLHVYCTAGIPDELTERHIELVCDHLVPAMAAGPAFDAEDRASNAPPA